MPDTDTHPVPVPISGEAFGQMLVDLPDAPSPMRAGPSTPPRAGTAEPERVSLAVPVGTWELDPVVRELLLDAESAAMLGLEPRPTGLSARATRRIVHPAHRRAARAALATALAQHVPLELEVRVLRADGAARWLRVQGRRQPLRHGSAILTGFVQDITEWKRLERRLGTEAAASHALAAATSPTQAGSDVVDAILSGLDADVCAVWLPERGGNHLRCAQLRWAAGGETRFPRFLQATRSTGFAPGEGLVGWVWQAQEPRWLESVTKEPSFRRGRQARLEGLTTGVAFPITSGGSPLGVIELYTSDVRARDPLLLETLEGIGNEFGQFLLRARAEEDLRQSEERLRVAKEAAGLGIHDFDPVSGAIHWDERIRELWGLDADELVTYELFLSGVHPEDRARTQAAVDRALDPNGRGVYDTEYRVTSRRDGKTRWISASGQVTFEDGRATRLVGTVEDITDRKLAERELRAALAAKDQFLAFVSHELRTPMTVVLGMSRLIAKGGLPEDVVRDLANDIADSGQELDDLIDGMLLLARIDSDVTERSREPVLLDRVVDDVVRRQRGRDPSRPYECRVETRDTLADATSSWVERVLFNFLGNAAKYSTPGRPVTVVVGGGDGEVQVRVQDEGTTLEEQDLGDVFEPFFRGQAHLGHTSGAGLGLSVCKRVIDELGGRIWFRARPSGGAEVGFALPLLTADDETSAEPRAVIAVQPSEPEETAASPSP